MAYYIDPDVDPHGARKLSFVTGACYYGNALAEFSFCIAIDLEASTSYYGYAMAKLLWLYNGRKTLWLCNNRYYIDAR